MSKVLVTESYLDDIADAIRGKNGTENTYKPPQMAAAITALPDPSNLDDKTITANGTYDPSDDDLDGYSEVTVNVPNSYAAGDEGKVVSNGALVAQTSRSSDITVNGTYDTTLNDEVTVNVSGGGGGVELLTRSEWNALTTAQKQAKGLIAIQDYSTGFDRGVLVNGLDYIPMNTYIPYSNEANVICEAYADNYDSSLLTWGYGDNPIQLSASGATKGDDYVYIPVYTSGVLAYVDLRNASSPFTAYIVCKIGNNSGEYTRIISSLYQQSSGKSIMLYGNNDVKVSSWGDSTANSGVIPTDYFVGVIQYNGSGQAYGVVINDSVQIPSFTSKTPSETGRYIVIGRTDINVPGTNEVPSDMYIKYLAVTNVFESQQVVSQNMTYLLDQFITNA